MHVSADITCTWPCNGKFTQQQSLVYNAVLDAHDAVVAAMAPGVCWSDMQVCMWGWVVLLLVVVCVFWGAASTSHDCAACKKGGGGGFHCRPGFVLPVHCRGEGVPARLKLWGCCQHQCRPQRAKGAVDKFTVYHCLSFCLFPPRPALCGPTHRPWRTARSSAGLLQVVCSRAMWRT